METYKNRKSVLITGSGKRIGAETAKFFSSKGYKVALHVNKSLKEAEELIENLAGDGHIILQGDLAKKEVCYSLIEESISHFGELDCLVCNASFFHEGKLENETEEIIDKSINVNLLSPVFMTLELMKFVKEGKQSNVILFGDQKLINLNKDNFSYTLSRMALYGSVRYLAMFTGPKLRVNMVMPGLTLNSGSQSTDNFNKYHNQTALGYGNTVEDITSAVYWLSEAQAITGQIITVDGGQHLIPTDRDVMYKQ